jgi:DHA1 family multidrug resistance protein-like MFS transporter
MAKRSAILIIIGRLITSYGYYMVIPFLAVYSTQYLGMNAIQAGILLGVLNLGRRGFGIPAGYLNDRFGFRRVLLAGLLLEVVGYASLAFVHTFLLLVLVIFIGGLGGCMYNISSRSVLASTKASGVAIDFSLFYLTMHIGALLGPLTTAWFINSNQIRIMFILAAISYVCFVVVALAFFHPENNAGGTSTALKFRDLLRLARHRQFMLYCVLITGCWFVFSQLYIGLPLYVTNQRLPDDLVPYLNGLNALIVILLQYPCGRIIEKLGVQARFGALILGTLLMSVAWLFCLMHGSLPLYMTITILTIGEVLFLGVVDVLASTFAPEGMSGLYLGSATLAWAIGGSLSSLLEGIGFSLAVQYQAINTFWIVNCILGVLAALAIWGTRVILTRTLIIENVSSATSNA